MYRTPPSPWPQRASPQGPGSEYAPQGSFWGALPPPPLSSLPTLLQKRPVGKKLVMARKNSVEGERQICLPKTRARGRGLWGPSFWLSSRRQELLNTQPALCLLLRETNHLNEDSGRELEVSLALLWPSVALTCPHTPAQPCWIAGAFTLACTDPAEGLHPACTGSIRLHYCAHTARKLSIILF